jgi:hypothetical protein
MEKTMKWYERALVGALALVLLLVSTLSRLTLAALYVLAITPLGLILRLFCDPLRLRRPSGRVTTYWTSRPIADNMASYLRQF